MTSPDNVGTASVDLIADGKGLAASIRKQIESAFKGLDFGKLIQDSIGDKPIKIPVEPDFDKGKLPKSLPKVPVEVDPVLDAAKADLGRQLSSLAKQIHASIPVDADTSGLRTELGSQLAEIAKQLKVPVPAEPGDRAAFQAKLQEQLDQVAGRVKAEVKVEADTSAIPEKVKATPIPKAKVEVDPVLSAFQQAIRTQVAALARAVNVNVPIGADTAGLRADLSAELAALRQSVSLNVPTQPGDQAAYEARLKAMLAAVSARVKQTVTVTPKVDSSGASGLLSTLSGLPGKLTPNILGGGAVSAIASAFQGLGDVVSKFAASAAAGGSQLAASIAAAAGPIAAVVGGLLSAQAAVVALGFAATLLAPAFAAAAGAAAAIPAALTGLGAVAGTLLLGFKGISDAFKPKAGGRGGSAGQSAAQQARQVASAARQVEAARRGITAANRSYEASERSLAAAQRGVAAAQRNEADAEDALAAAQKRVTQTQQAVNKAREQATDDLIDMNLQLKDSQLSEEEASLAVTDALRDLNSVKLTGNIPDIQKADLAYQRAQLTLEESTQSTKELSKQTQDANAKGVEGSDKVQSALQDQADALDGVKKAQEGVVDAQTGILDAADSLKSAQDGVLSAADGIKSAQDSLASATDSLAQAQTKQAAGAAAAAQQITKLAPAATAFVNALKALKPAFDGLRLDVQQRLFAGLDQTVTHLGDAWIPALKVTLGSYADTFNTFFKNLGTAVTTPQFITDLQTGAEGARQGLEKIGDSITKSLLPAFGTLSAAAGPFLSQLGGEIADIVTDFSNWIQQANNTGKLQTFFDRAGAAMHDIFNTGGLVVKIVGQIIGIIVGTQNTSGKTSLDSFNDGLQKISDWLADPNHQKQIADFVNDLKDGLKQFGDAVLQVKGFLDTISGEKGHSHSVGYDIGSSLVSGLIAGIGGAFVGLNTSWIGYFLPGGVFIKPILDALGIHSPSTVFEGYGNNVIEGFVKGLGFGPVSDHMSHLFDVVTGPVKNAGNWLVDNGQGAVIGLSNGISKQFPGLSTKAGQIKTTVTNKLSDAGTWLSTHGGNTVIGFINGIGARLGQVGTAARNIATYAINGIGNLYNQMLTIGSNVVIGIYNGISSMGSWLYNKLISFAKAVIPGPIAAALGINSPSKVAAELGSFVSQGLALGITSEGDKVKAAADEIAAKAMPQVPDVTLGLGAMADAKLSASLQASAQQQLLIGFKPNARGDKWVEALRDSIDVTYQGDIDRALTKPR